MNDEKDEPAIPVITIIVLVIVLSAALFLSGCSGLAQVVDKATEHGRDERCVTGLGMEFCYFRLRTKDEAGEGDE